MRPTVREINLNAMAPKVDVDNRISLYFYYRIADNLLKQLCYLRHSQASNGKASIYREEKNLIDLYIILLRFSSLLCETIPYHRDYLTFLPKQRAAFRRKLADVISELETLKPNVHRQVYEMNQQYIAQLGIGERTSYSSTDSVSLPSTKKQNFLNPKEQVGSTLTSSSWRYNENNLIRSLDQSKVDKQFLKPFLTLPQPKEETLSRHSFLGPSGLQGRKAGTVTGIRVQYPSNTDLSKIEMPSLSQARFDLKSDNSNSRKPISEMDSVLFLDDGRWSQPSVDAISENCLQLDIKQPSPPPVLARVQPQQGFASIPPSQVADPRPGPAKTYDNDLPDTNTYKHLHIPIKMMELFLRLAESNTAKNLETCGVLAGSLKNKNFCVTTLIIPKQEATSDSCQTTDEEEIFDFQDKRALFPLGWIHTHPTQTCFMSSVDLHTHYSYQIMLPEAIAIVMAPTDESRTHGIFHLSDPGGVSIIRNCQKRGFHPHEEPSDGSPLYKHCSHVYMNPNLQIEVADLR